MVCHCSSIVSYVPPGVMSATWSGMHHGASVCMEMLAIVIIAENYRYSFVVNGMGTRVFSWTRRERIPRSRFLGFRWMATPSSRSF
ncbi:hypothetical protein KXD40_006546 [Peronospora effusa]|nr:hypothetical protein KXD40_006546 [Peronospora effusa]